MCITNPSDPTTLVAKPGVPESPHDQRVRKAITRPNVNLGRCFNTQGLGFRFGFRFRSKRCGHDMGFT